MAWTRRRLVLAMVRFAGLIVVLLLPWPGLDTAFVKAYAFVADRAFAGWVGGNLLQVHLFPSPDHLAFLSWNAEVAFVSKASGASLYMASVDCWRAVYLPVGVFLAFCFAWLPRRRGLVVVILLAGIATLASLPALILIETSARMGGVHLGTALFAMLITANRALWAPPGMAFIAPAALWLVLLALANRCSSARMHLPRSRLNRAIRPPQTTGAARAPGASLRVVRPDRLALGRPRGCRAPRPG
jgi:hypothetical protein